MAPPAERNLKLINMKFKNSKFKWLYQEIWNTKQFFGESAEFTLILINVYPTFFFKLLYYYYFTVLSNISCENVCFSFYTSVCFSPELQTNKNPDAKQELCFKNNKSGILFYNIKPHLTVQNWHCFV